MKAVILCGGQGARIRDVNEVLPKPMLPIGGKPVLWHIMKTYAQYGVKEFVLCLGYKGWLIKEFFLNYRAMVSNLTITLGRQRALEFDGEVEEEDWRVTLAETGESTMTAGRVVAVRRYLEHCDAFHLAYGDGVANVDIERLTAFHRANRKIVTMTAVRPPGRFGEITLAGATITAFNEKPQTSEGYINGGFMVCDARRIWEYLGSNPTTVLEREPLQQLARDGELVAYRHDGFWQPMDTVREYTQLNDRWAANDAPWKTWD